MHLEENNLNKIRTMFHENLVLIICIISCHVNIKHNTWIRDSQLLLQVTDKHIVQIIRIFINHEKKSNIFPPNMKSRIIFHFNFKYNEKVFRNQSQFPTSEHICKWVMNIAYLVLKVKFSGKDPGSAHQIPSVSNSSGFPIFSTSKRAF